MVVKLWGTCNGTDILCTPIGGERWATTVPASADGSYIIELWAEDEAGNRGYFATIEITYDTAKLCFSVRVLEVGAAFTADDVLRTLIGDRFGTEFRVGAVDCSLLGERIESEIVKCEVCGE